MPTPTGRRRRHRLLRELAYRRWLTDRRAYYTPTGHAYKGEDNLLQRAIFKAYQRDATFQRRRTRKASHTHKDGRR